MSPVRPVAGRDEGPQPLEATLSRTSPKYYPAFLQSLRIAQTGLEKREEVIWYIAKAKNLWDERENN